jgi:hypothetical protein
MNFAAGSTSDRRTVAHQARMRRQVEKTRVWMRVVTRPAKLHPHLTNASMPSPYRDLVAPEHRAYFDALESLIRRLQTKRGAAALGPTLWAAIATALAQSVQAHRALVDSGSEAAGERLALAELLLAELTDANSASDVLPAEFGRDSFPLSGPAASGGTKLN